MQSFSDLFASNRLLAVGVVLAAVAVILAVGVALFRLVFGRRLHMSGGRTRQPRLGVVDAFDLDRQRQLVLIRRDNVEHLLMIGGPNDVLVEASIVRAPVAVAGRDKDNGFGPSVGVPAPMPQQPALPVAPQAPLAAATVPAGGPEGGATAPIPAALPAEPRLGGAVEQVRPAPSVEVQSPPPVVAAPQESRLPPANGLPTAGTRVVPTQPAARPASSLPPRPPVSPASRPATGPTPRANLSRATPVAPPAAGPGSEPRQPGRVEPVMGRGTGESPAAGTERPVSEGVREPVAPVRFPPGPARRPETQPPVGIGSDAGRTAGSPDQSAPSATSDDATAATPRPTRTATPIPNRTLPPRPAVTAPPSPVPAPPPNRAPLPSMSSLEEEMAKLLGRPMPPPSDTTNT